MEYSGESSLVQQQPKGLGTAGKGVLRSYPVDGRQGEEQDEVGVGYKESAMPADARANFAAQEPRPLYFSVVAAWLHRRQHRELRLARSGADPAPCSAFTAERTGTRFGYSTSFSVL